MEKQQKKREKKKRDSKIMKLKKKRSSQSLSKVKQGGLSPPKPELTPPLATPSPMQNEAEMHSETPKRPKKKASKSKMDEIPKKPSSKRVQIAEQPTQMMSPGPPRIISKTGLSPDNTEGGDKDKDPYYTSSMIRRDLYNVMDEADKISEIKPVMLPPTAAPGPGGLSPNGSAQKNPVSKSLQVTQSDMTGAPASRKSDQIPPQPIRSDLQLPNTIGIVKNARGGVSAHPLSLARIDGDLLGRTGMYLERSGMSTAKKRAFDWLGLNRHQYAQKAAETVKNLEVALSDVGISKDLFFQTLNILLADQQITEPEMLSIKQQLQNSPDFLTMSKAAWILKEVCNTYRRPQDFN
ncbi:unnamed protein product [Caenorhabditis angaria]|uniref:Uncharacterized protein n=1 Tax=Caenorhabditis angaria TaxID=860376 RepID=A0A9P1IR22_9PELO|nr:unnamed protein product [Caenorhabditis angaria]